MAEVSKIAWTDGTFNPWIGCSRVSPGCENCYAENLMDHRYHRVKWGPGQPRTRTKTWKDPLKWNREAEKAGHLVDAREHYYIAATFYTNAMWGIYEDGNEKRIAWAERVGLGLERPRRPRVGRARRVGARARQRGHDQQRAHVTALRRRRRRAGRTPADRPGPSEVGCRM